MRKDVKTVLSFWATFFGVRWLLHKVFFVEEPSWTIVIIAIIVAFGVFSYLNSAIRKDR